MLLVLGTPDPVAVRLTELLAQQGESIAVLAGPDDTRPHPDGVKIFRGDAASIDFGLTGTDYRELLKSVTELMLVDTTHLASADVESSRMVRQAAEVAEFVKAGGAPGGVRYLSSLLVFGSAAGGVSEEELNVGQSFRDPYEESLAVAEKLIQGLGFVRPVSVVRTGPVGGDERSGQLIMGSALSHLVSDVESAPDDKGYSYSDLPVRLETVDRAALALLKAVPREFLSVIHLVDAEPLTDRRLVEWLAERLGKPIHEAAPGARPWLAWARSTYPGCRALRGWGLRFDRANAEALLPDLLDRDDYAVLDKLFAREAGKSAW